MRHAMQSGCLLAGLAIINLQFAVRSLSGVHLAGSAAENGHADDDRQHGLQDLAAARAAMADGGEEAASQLDDNDEVDELFRVHASARGADADSADEAEAAAVPTPDGSAAAPASGIFHPRIVRSQA